MAKARKAAKEWRGERERFIGREGEGGNLQGRGWSRLGIGSGAELWWLGEAQQRQGGVGGPHPKENDDLC